MAESKSMQAKISMLQTQVALMSLTIASMQSHIKEMDSMIKQMQQPPLITINDDLGIDDNCYSEGYDTDESDTPDAPTLSVNADADNPIPYVLVSWEDEGYESDENTLEEL